MAVQAVQPPPIQAVRRPAVQAVHRPAGLKSPGSSSGSVDRPADLRSNNGLSGSTIDYGSVDTDPLQNPPGIPPGLPEKPVEARFSVFAGAHNLPVRKVGSAHGSVRSTKSGPNAELLAKLKLARIRAERLKQEEEIAELEMMVEVEHSEVDSQQLSDDTPMPKLGLIADLRPEEIPVPQPFMPPPPRPDGWLPYPRTGLQTPPVRKFGARASPSSEAQVAESLRVQIQETEARDRAAE